MSEENEELPQKQNKESETIDIRKLNFFQALQEAWRFIKKWDIGSHLVIWGLLASFIFFIHGTINYFEDKGSNLENKKLTEQLVESNKSLYQLQIKLEQANSKIDSLTNKRFNPLTVRDTIHDTIFIENKTNKAIKENKFYNVSISNIKEGIAFNDKVIGVSITLSNISSDYTATAVHDIPEPFGSVSSKSVKVTAGKFWKFRKNGKNYKLVITKIDYYSDTYGIDLFEIDS